MNPVKLVLTGFFIFARLHRVFSNIPFFRIVLPFFAGILLALKFETISIDLLILSLLLCAAVLVSFYEKRNTLTRVMIILLSDVFLFAYGISITTATRITNDQKFYGNMIGETKNATLLVSINDIPIPRNNFIKCKAKVIEVRTDSGYIPAKGDLILYFKRSTDPRDIKFGDVILIHTGLQELEGPKNPFEFDYKEYLENKQIIHTAFIEPGRSWLVEGQSVIHRLWQYGLIIRSNILNNLREHGLTPQTFAICSALLTGYDDEIDKSTTEAFSHSGTLHVLSVSGLHTGIIYVVLAFLFDLIDRNRKYKILKFCFISIVLWLFALITGFSAPVLRAVIMFNLFGIGDVFFRNHRSNKINLLLFSAFLILCYDPFLIKDIGFQLSYFALAGILIFQPWMSNLFKSGNKFGKYFSDSVSTSFSATLGTLPLTLFYFKQFPFWFFICNLVVVPVSFIALFLSIIAAANFFNLSFVLNTLVTFMIGFIQLFDHPGVGYIDNIDFTLIDTILMFCVIVLFSVSVYERSYNYLKYTLFFIILWQLNGIIDSYLSKSKNVLTVYQVRKEKVLGVKSSTTVWMDTVKKEIYDQHIKPHLISFNHPAILHGSYNYIESKEDKIMILELPGKSPNGPISEVSILVVTNNFDLDEKSLENFERLRVIVADGSNNSKTIKKLKELSVKFGVSFYSTRTEGAFILEL